jgi:hypothetical protein
VNSSIRRLGRLGRSVEYACMYLNSDDTARREANSFLCANKSIIRVKYRGKVKEREGEICRMQSISGSLDAIDKLSRTHLNL